MDPCSQTVRRRWPKSAKVEMNLPNRRERGVSCLSACLPTDVFFLPRCLSVGRAAGWRRLRRQRTERTDGRTDRDRCCNSRSSKSYSCSISPFCASRLAACLPLLSASCIRSIGRPRPAVCPPYVYVQFSLLPTYTWT